MKKLHIYILVSLLLIFIWSCQNENFSPTDPTNDQNLELNKKGGSALDFNGSTGYVEVPDHPSLDITDEFTISAWIYFNPGIYPIEYASIVTKGIVSNNYTLHSSGDGRFYLTGKTTTGGFQFESDNVALSL